MKKTFPPDENFSFELLSERNEVNSDDKVKSKSLKQIKNHVIIDLKRYQSQKITTH